MQKKILVFGCLLLLFPVGVAATEIGDNSLQIDSSRIEKEEELKLGNQDQLIQSLFLASEQEELIAKKHLEQTLLQNQQDSLFQAGEKPSTDVLQVGTLFDSTSHKNMTTKVDGVARTNAEGLISGIFWMSLVVGILVLASLASYFVSKDEDTTRLTK